MIKSLNGNINYQMMSKNKKINYVKELETVSIRFPNVQTHEWEQDGKKYRSHKIDCGTAGTINCGDAGLELFYKTFQKQGFKTLNNGK